jgi:hypothetical protein
MVRMPPCGMPGMAPPVTIAKALTGPSRPVPMRSSGVSSARISAPSGHGSAQSEHAADEARDNNPNYHVPGHVLLAQALCAYQIHPLGSKNYSEIGQTALLRTFQRQRVRSVPNLVAANDIYGLLFAVTQRNRYGLRGAARHICSDNWCRGWFRRTNNRRTSMCPIPRNIICARVMDVA